MHRQGRILAALCTALAAAVSVASCATSTPSGSGQPGSGTHGSGQPGSGAGQSGSAPASPTQSCAAGWRTDSLTVTRQVTVPTLPVGVQPVSDPMLKAWTVSGDFEGVLSVALGLVGGSRYRVGELGSRIYVDV